MYLEQPKEGAPAVHLARLHAYPLGALAAATLILGLYWAPLIGFISRSLAQWGGQLTRVAALGQ